ncbi:hypothetical protein F4811DRAFT_554871 [Daldinia bambusicola]|nr:hypothetical protein F4811DRAFT_554871 [Daldinia bambusicola]
MTEPSAVREIQLYMRKHRLIQSLVRITIQLDALCQAKEKITKGPSPDTMATIYEAITQRLWGKDIVRLGKRTQNFVNVASKSEIDERIKPEAEYLEYLAFNGMYNDAVEFCLEHRHKIRTHIGFNDPKFPLHEQLGRPSFLQSSGYLDSTKSNQSKITISYT